jgi:RNA polymerase sigma-70 factor, ECF subfamily
MNRNRELAEDLVQDVFFRVLRYRASYDAAQSFTGRMYQIARRASLDRAHKQRGEVVEIDELESPARGPEAAAAHGQNLALLKRALGQLPPDKREVLILSRFQEMKHEDIAVVLGCEVGTVKVRVYRAMRALEQVYFELEKEKAS